MAKDNQMQSGSYAAYGATSKTGPAIDTGPEISNTEAIL